MLCAVFAGCWKADETAIETPEQADKTPALWKLQGFAISPDNAEKQELNVDVAKVINNRIQLYLDEE